MPPRNHKNWTATPKVEYISSECYNNFEVFQQEQELIFSKVWIPMCHISEMYEKGHFRTTQIAGQNVIAYNTGELGTRAFLNHGPQLPSGKLFPSDETFGKELHCEVRHGGMVWVNAPLLDNDAGPFGGSKMSGIGRQLGPEGIDTFRETKMIMIDPESSSQDFWWFPYADEEMYSNEK